MKKIIFAFMAFTAWAVQTRAADGITIANANVPKGGEAVVEVMLTSADMSYGGFQFEVTLPAGVSLVKVEKAARLTAIDNYMLQKSLTDEENNTYTLLGYNTERQSIAGTSGAIAYLTLQANADMTVGEVFDATVQNVVLSNVDEEDIDAPGSSFTVTIVEPLDSRVVLDENSETAPEASDGEVEVLVKRTIKASEWSTICLPFDMSEGQLKEVFGDDVQLEEFIDYEIDNEDNIIINFEDALPYGLCANYPYLIKTSADITEFTTTAVIDPAPDNAIARYDNGRPVNNPRYVLYGSFTGVYQANTVVPESCLFISGNKFWYSTGNTKMKAFRGYFWLMDVLSDVEQAGARISFSFNEATGISNVNVNHNSNSYYDLQGRRVETPRKGLYINNGKKMVVK